MINLNGKADINILYFQYNFHTNNDSNIDNVDNKYSDMYWQRAATDGDNDYIHNDEFIAM